jgi:4-hydroxybenzoate polyprenyltransferase
VNRIGALLSLTRIEHSFMLVVAVVAAELIVGGLPGLSVLAASIISPIFISAGSFAINDYYDVEADTINKRSDRPLVAGTITKKMAKDTAFACFAIGVLVCLAISTLILVVAAIFAVLAFLYSYRLKDTLLVGNLYVSVSYAIPFIFGALVVSGTVPVAIVLICFVAFCSGLGREIHGMVRDLSGDRLARKTHNVVAQIGVRRSLEFAFILYAEAIAISIFLFFYFAPFLFNLVYLAFITVADIMLFYVAVAPMFKPAAKTLKIGRNVSLAGMSIALFGYLFSALFFVPLLL